MGFIVLALLIGIIPAAIAKIREGTSADGGYMVLPYS